MAALKELLRQHREITLIAPLSLGFFLGKWKVGNFSLGYVRGRTRKREKARINPHEIFILVAWSFRIYSPGLRDRKPVAPPPRE
jgi:hypothetical protein